MEGWLFRSEKGLIKKVIRRRWFVLSSTTLEWYANDSKQERKGELDLTVSSRQHCIAVLWFP